MKCVSPITIQKKAYKDKATDTMKIARLFTVPCGKCYPCLSNRKNQWVFRLEVEAYDSVNSWFLTLTQDDEHLEDVNKRALQLLFKKLRNDKHSFKYYAIGEYGSKTGRPHYHIALFMKDESDIEKGIAKHWKKGHYKLDRLNIARINYVLHYHIRPKEVNGKSTFAIMSKGLGNSLFEDERTIEHFQNKTEFMIQNKLGSKTWIPRYYRKKYNMKQKNVEIKDITFDILNMDEKHEYRYSLIQAFKDKLKKYNNQEKF